MEERLKDGMKKKEGKEEDSKERKPDGNPFIDLYVSLNSFIFVLFFSSPKKK